MFLYDPNWNLWWCLKIVSSLGEIYDNLCFFTTRTLICLVFNWSQFSRWSFRKSVLLPDTNWDFYESPKCCVSTLPNCGNKHEFPREPQHFQHQSLGGIASLITYLIDNSQGHRVYILLMHWMVDIFQDYRDHILTDRFSLRNDQQHMPHITADQTEKYEIIKWNFTSQN